MFKNITNRVKTYIVDKSEEIFQKCKCRKKFIRISYVLLILHSFSLISDIHLRLSSYLRIVDRSENAHLTVARFKGVQFQRPARIPMSMSMSIYSRAYQQPCAHGVWRLYNSE